MHVIYELHDVYDWNKDDASMVELPLSQRELWCYSEADDLADLLVEEYYCWKLEDGPLPLTMKTDSSTGLGQIFASTAITAMNHDIDKGIADLEIRYDSSKPQDIWNVWSMLRFMEDFNIQCCALVILDCQYEFASTTPYEEFFYFSEAQVKTILARYNGTGDDAVEYGKTCYDYFEIFKYINN